MLYLIAIVVFAVVGYFIYSSRAASNKNQLQNFDDVKVSIRFDSAESESYDSPKFDREKHISSITGVRV